jgi:hypothetical protein
VNGEREGIPFVKTNDRGSAWEVNGGERACPRARDENCRVACDEQLVPDTIVGPLQLQNCDFEGALYVRRNIAEAVERPATVLPVPDDDLMPCRWLIDYAKVLLGVPPEIPKLLHPSVVAERELPPPAMVAVLTVVREVWGAEQDPLEAHGGLGGGKQLVELEHAPCRDCRRQLAVESVAVPVHLGVGNVTKRPRPGLVDPIHLRGGRAGRGPCERRRHDARSGVGGRRSLTRTAMPRGSARTGSSQPGFR